MPGRLSRRDNILKAAGDLFLKQGYQATTVRQIAEAVGCTEAALYYHFKGGKRELLQRVIEDVELDLRSAVQALEQAASLSDLVRRYGSAVADMRGGRIQRTIRWISYEMPSLTPEERRPFYEALLTFQRALTGAVGCFIGDPEEADQIGWLLLCTSFGFRQIFYDLDLESQVQVDVTRLFDLLSNAFEQAPEAEN